jgi:hypothetical protein
VFSDIRSILNMDIFVDAEILDRICLRGLKIMGFAFNRSSPIC